MRTHGAGKIAAVVGLDGYGPSARPPRFVVSPCPRNPWLLAPQHLTVASSCVEEQPRITDCLSKERWVESLTGGLQAR